MRYPGIVVPQGSEFGPSTSTRAVFVCHAGQRQGAFRFIGTDYVFRCNAQQSFDDFWIAGSLCKMRERSRLTAMIVWTY